MLLAMTSRDARMSAATPIQRVAIPPVSSTKNTALVPRAKATLRSTARPYFASFRTESQKSGCSRER